jgi:hypothetical protein
MLCQLLSHFDLGGKVSGCRGQLFNLCDEPRSKERRRERNCMILNAEGRLTDIFVA